MHNRGQFLADEEEIFGGSFILIDLTDSKRYVTNNDITTNENLLAFN